jgi:hypothetical protein
MVGSGRYPNNPLITGGTPPIGIYLERKDIFDRRLVKQSQKRGNIWVNKKGK